MTEGEILKCRLGVRYWEDSSVDGFEDTKGDLMPCVVNGSWCPEINVKTGQILNWEKGKEADIHYKVCDDGDYMLLDDRGYTIINNNSYVPDCLCPKEQGYGDYVIMDIDQDGYILGFIDNYNEEELINYLRDDD